MSPEILSELPYTYSTDVWSLGVMLYEMCTHGVRPFKNAEETLKGQFAPLT